MALTRLQKLIKSVSVDGRLTQVDVSKVIGEAKKRGVTTSEKKHLSELLTRNADKFDADAKATLTQFLGAGNSIPLSADPAVLPGNQFAYETIAGGRLFVGGPRAEDVIQGQLGSCYYLAALASAAHANPKLIQDAIKDNKDGTFTVRLYKYHPGGYKAEYVRVDADFPSTGGKPAYGRSLNPKEMWVSLFEKALAAQSGGYENIHGANSKWAFETMTGKDAKGYVVERALSADPEMTYQRIKSALANRQPIAVGSAPAATSGILPMHEYSLLGVEETAGKRYVTLRNPWGNTEAGNDGRNDGTFKMSFEDFQTQFFQMTVPG